MRLFVECRSCQSKIYLQFPAQRRIQLPQDFTVACQYGHQSEYSRAEVRAESTPLSAVGGAIVGDLVGLLGGPLGLVLGTVLGGGAGAAADNADAERAQQFNAEVA